MIIVKYLYILNIFLNAVFSFLPAKQLLIISNNLLSFPAT